MLLERAMVFYIMLSIVTICIYMYIYLLGSNLLLTVCDAHFNGGGGVSGSYWVKILCSPWSRIYRSVMLGFATVKLFSKYSNLCDHDTSTSQTDGQTDRWIDDLPLQYCALRSIAR